MNNRQINSVDGIAGIAGIGGIGGRDRCLRDTPVGPTLAGTALNEILDHVFFFDREAIVAPDVFGDSLEHKFCNTHRLTP